MFERRGEPLLPTGQFILRLMRHAGYGLALVIGSLLIGMVGYHQLEGLSWVDSFLNASMILGGMGPVAQLTTDAGKVFAGLYALYAGMIFLVAVGILLLPALHRVLHSFHVEESDGAEKPEASQTK